MQLHATAEKMRPRAMEYDQYTGPTGDSTRDVKSFMFLFSSAYGPIPVDRSLYVCGLRPIPTCTAVLTANSPQATPWVRSLLFRIMATCAPRAFPIAV